MHIYHVHMTMLGIKGRGWELLTLLKCDLSQVLNGRQNTENIPDLYMNTVYYAYLSFCVSHCLANDLYHMVHTNLNDCG